MTEVGHVTGELTVAGLCELAHILDPTVLNAVFENGTDKESVSKRSNFVVNFLSYTTNSNTDIKRMFKYYFEVFGKPCIGLKLYRHLYLFLVSWFSSYIIICAYGKCLKFDLNYLKTNNFIKHCVNAQFVFFRRTL